MAMLMQAIYNGIFKFFCLPVFLLMLVGRPRFLIGWVHKLINMKEPFFKLRLFRFIFFLCSVTVAWSFYMKWSIEKMIQKLGSEIEKERLGINTHYIDEKLRQAHLFERNAYMFFTFIVLMIIVEKFCHSYFKLWALEDKYKGKLEDAKIKEAGEHKDPMLKKTE